MAGQAYAGRLDDGTVRERRGPAAVLVDGGHSARAAVRAAVFFIKLFPMWSSRPVDLVTRRPVREVINYPTRSGMVEAELYRPPGPGPHPAMVVCLGVVPFGVDHPQVPRLEEALARSGFVGLIHWSPAMRDLRLEPGDVEETAEAYKWLIVQPYVDPTKSGLMGTCVGGAFALMAAAHPAIRDRVGFVAAFAPYSSMWTLARDIASATRDRDGASVPWAVDQLTRKVFVRTLTSYLQPRERDLLRRAFSEEGGQADTGVLSEEGRAVYALLSGLGPEGAQTALERLPERIRESLSLLSPVSYLRDLRAPVVCFGHDREDGVIPVGESRRLQAALAGRAGVHYTEFDMFQHADPTKRKLPIRKLARELGKFYRFAYPMYRQAVGA